MACRVKATRLRGFSLPFLEMPPARDEKAAATPAQVTDAVVDELLWEVPGRPPKARHVLFPTLLLVVRPPLLLPRGSPKQRVCMLQLFDRVKSYIRIPLWVDKILHQYCFCYFHYDMHRVEPTPLPLPETYNIGPTRKH